MVQFFVNRIIPKDFNPQHPAHRQQCGARAGLVGVVLNILLSAGKCGVGFFTGSIAVIADGINNLSDAAASVVTLVGFRLAGQSADEEHPFGHGRMEYLAGFVVALAILMMGIEVGQNAFMKLFRPESINFSWISIAMLAISILVKLWMGAFFHGVGVRMDSSAMEATAADARSDVIATSVVLVATLVEHFTSLQIDAYAGLLVAVFILRAGWEATQDALDPLLGRAMSPELAADIDRIVLDHPNIVGIHDLVYHDYGPGRAMMSLHAEVPADCDFLALHDIIDHIERELKETHHVETVIHMDPVVCDEATDTLRQQIIAIAKELDSRMTIHDFRITAGPDHTNVLFDMVVPFGFHMEDKVVKSHMTEAIRGLSERYYPVIEVDHSFVN